MNQNQSWDNWTSKREFWLAIWKVYLCNIKTITCVTINNFASHDFFVIYDRVQNISLLFTPGKMDLIFTYLDNLILKSKEIYTCDILVHY